MFILMSTITVYAYVLPYKEMIVNIIELLFQSTLLMFLMLRSTRNIIESYLRFPNYKYGNVSDDNGCSSETGIAYLTWILFPFTYFPLVVIMGVFIAKMMLRLG